MAAGLGSPLEINKIRQSKVIKKFSLSQASHISILPEFNPPSKESGAFSWGVAYFQYPQGISIFCW
jgi:hypothetical protein